MYILYICLFMIWADVPKNHNPEMMFSGILP